MSKQELSRDNRAAIDGMVTMVMTSHHKCVYKALPECDVVVRRPDLVVKALIKAGLIKRDCFTEAVNAPDGNMKRIALFGVSFSSLAKRRDSIVDFVNDAPGIDPTGYGVSPVDGETTFALLLKCVGHAHLAEPSLIEADPVLQGFCEVFGQAEVYTAITQGGAVALGQLIHQVQGSN